ncbi:MAG: hypothetical protein KKF52_02670 [Nanoarchaeota archaeon]|nr:hypothetical protein [Nanoarchaeota archaeon]MBU4242113.1 hypothetical protein [Nanoarchaeota archaeon]MBU4352393.1 hypothetical protein [Nanoarchaeota archaeon]
MQNKLISIRLPEKMLNDAKNITSTGLFSNLNDFIRASIRKSIDDYQTKKALLELKKGFGTMEGKIKRLTHKEREKLVKEFFKEKKAGRDIFKEYNL